MQRFALLPSAALLAIGAAADVSYCCYDGCDHVQASSCETRTPDNWCAQTQSNCEGGCGGAWCPGSIPTPTPPPTPPAPTPTPPPPTPPTPAPPPGTRTPIYVVLRMDDISYGSVQNEQASVINWAIEHKVKFNFGVITSSWPLDCAENPGNYQCEAPQVKALRQAYLDGHVRGKGEEPIIEISNHAWGHEEWSNQWEDFETPKPSFDAWQMTDMQRSQAALKQAFPEASVRAFIAPTCRATAGTLKAMKAVGLDIISAQGQLGCNEDPGEAPQYNYWYAPCENEEGGTHKAECVPPGDIYFTADGFQALPDKSYSAPGGSCNSNLNVVENGLSVTETLGVDQCGCNGDESCPIISSAIQNARKSNGLHWTVVMMHPQTVFPNGQTYVSWLDELLATSQALEDYEFHFINFQDLLNMKSQEALVVTV